MQMLLAYDAALDVVATLDYVVAQDEDGNVVGLVDAGAHEDAGGQLTDIWVVGNAAGSCTWPEWLGGSALEFKVELTGKRITALVHRGSGHRRERAAIERAIAATPVVDGARDIRHIVGGPQRPLVLDEDGRTAPPRPRRPTAAGLPIHGRKP